MKISLTKYMALIAKIHWQSLPPLLQEAHSTIMKDTDNGQNWKLQETDSELKQLIEVVYQKCTELIASNRKYLTPKDVAMHLLKRAAEEHEDIEAYLHEFKLSVNKEDFSAHTEGTKVIVTSLYGTKIHEVFEAKPLVPEILSSYVEHQDRIRLAKPKRAVYKHRQPEFRILKAILAWDNMLVARKMVESLIDQVKAFRKDKTLSRTSPVFNEIKLVQEKLEAVMAAMENTATVKLSPETKALWRKALKKVTAPKNGKKDQEELSGITPTIEPVSAGSVSKQEVPSPILSSEEFAKTQFKTIGLKGKWLRLIGDPSPGFKAMVFGMPKMGKSYLCVDFASYLSKNHGKVLYVSKEEFMSPTLALKLKDKDAANANLDIAGALPADLSAYQFVFLDSVTSLKLTPDDLKALEQKYPGISFIYVFQVTKAGSARGTNEYMHNVDVVIEIPEKGKAVQFGRFNQGGEMNIFEGNSSEDELAPEALFGLNKKRKEEDWTEGEYLTEGDKYFLKKIKEAVDKGRLAEAMEWASRGETEVREAIPGEIWLAMGGTLTKTGWEKLKKRGFTSEEIKRLQQKSESHEEEPEDDDDEEPEIKEMSLLHSSKPEYRPVGADIYRHTDSLSQINYALRGLKSVLEGQFAKKLKVGEYLDIVKIAVRKHPDLFPFTEDVSRGLNDIFFRLLDSYKDWKNGVTPDTVKPQPYKPREGSKMHFTPSPGLAALSIYYDKNVTKLGAKGFSEILTAAVEKDDLLYYNLHDLERVFSRVLEQIKNATNTRK